MTLLNIFQNVQDNHQCIPDALFCVNLCSISAQFGRISQFRQISGQETAKFVKLF